MLPKAALLGRNLVVIGLALLSGCGSSATIWLKNGKIVHGTIEEGDEKAILIDTGYRERYIEQDSIADIDHPGNAAATIGVLLSLYGAINIALGVPKCDEKGPLWCIAVFAPAGAGIGLMGHGFSTYARSVNATHSGPRDRESFRWLVSPSYARVGGSGGPGLMLMSSF